MKNELMQGTRIPEFHFGFGGVDIHIHAVGIHLKEQRKGWMPIQMKYIAIGFT